MDNYYPVNVGNTVLLRICCLKAYAHLCPGIGAHETVTLIHQYWQLEKANLPLSADTIQDIDTHLKTLPIT